MDPNNLDSINVIFNSIGLIQSLFILTFTGLIIYIILNRISSKSVEIKVILILCLVEIELGLSKLVICILKLLYGKEVLNQGTAECYYNGIEYQLVARIEIFIICVLSVMRYLIVCHGINKRFKLWLLILIIGCSLPLSIFIYGAILHDAKPQVSYLLCAPFTTPNQTNFIIGCTLPFFYIIPSWVITFNYFAIGYKVNKQLNQMKVEASANQDDSLLKAIRHQKIKIIIQLTTVIILYNANFSIVYVTHVLKFAIGYNRTPIVESIAYLAVLTTFTLNPVLTITFQPELNHELTAIIFKLNSKIKKLFSRLFQ